MSMAPGCTADQLFVLAALIAVVTSLFHVFPASSCSVIVVLWHQLMLPWCRQRVELVELDIGIVMKVRLGF